MSAITFGLSQILIGTAATSGTMPGSLTKIGKTYKETCKLAQAESEVTEHFEEGKSSPAVRVKTKKIPVLKFSILDPDATLLKTLVGGTLTGSVWSFNGTEAVANAAIRVMSEQGLWVDVPNGDIDAVVNADFSKKGIFLIDVTVTPMEVDNGESIKSYVGGGLTVSPTSLSFTSAADATGKTIAASSTGNITFAAGPSDVEWLTVTKSAKVATVKVLANTNGEARSANVTIVADGLTAIVPVTQAGA